MMFGIQYSNHKGSKERIKEILMARGFYKKEGINSQETLTPRIKVHDEVKTSLP